MKDDVGSSSSDSAEESATMENSAAFASNQRSSRNQDGRLHPAPGQKPAPVVHLFRAAVELEVTTVDPWNPDQEVKSKRVPATYLLNDLRPSGLSLYTNGDMKLNAQVRFKLHTAMYILAEVKRCEPVSTQVGAGQIPRFRVALEFVHDSPAMNQQLAELCDRLAKELQRGRVSFAA